MSPSAQSQQREHLLLNPDAPKMRLTELMMSVSSYYVPARLERGVYHNLPAEFAFEIGSGLLTEVRRLQSLLGERDKAIQDMKEEKDDLEKSGRGAQDCTQATGTKQRCVSVLTEFVSYLNATSQTSSKKRIGIWKFANRSSRTATRILRHPFNVWNLITKD